MIIIKTNNRTLLKQSNKTLRPSNQMLLVVPSVKLKSYVSQTICRSIWMEQITIISKIYNISRQL